MIFLHLYLASLTIDISNVKSLQVTDNAVLPLFFRVKNYLVPTCTVCVQHGKDPCFPYSAPIVFCSVALMSEFDLVDVDFLLLNFL